MDSIKEKQTIALQACLRTTLKYGGVGVLISIGVGDKFDPILGIWTYPIMFIGLFGFFYVIKYSPNWRADVTLTEWRGEEYLTDLRRQMQSKSYAQLLHENWFSAYLEDKEKSDPPSASKWVK